MLESPLSATWRPAVREKAVLVGVGPGIDEGDLDELEALADSAGAESVSRVVQSRQEPDPATYIGRGKLEEVHDEVHRSGADSVILDQELSPGQLRSLEERLGVKVIDRTALILDIFALHARSREGKAQVELAQLNYLLPRLRGWGEAMSRAGGGIGTRFGGGETKMEVDRQHIGRRIAKLRRELKTLARTRETKRARRQGSGIPQAAIAGYTNAGKSTLMNRLTGADVIVADQLFATLDPTVRQLKLPGGRRCTISDTVGFVSKLPHDLVEAFRSTLEEVSLAELVVHVADAASPDARRADRGRSTGARRDRGRVDPRGARAEQDRPAERVRARSARSPLSRGRCPVSALAGGGGRGPARDARADGCRIRRSRSSCSCPYGREDLTALLYRESEVLSTTHERAGTRVHARVGLRELAAVRGFVQHERRIGLTGRSALTGRGDGLSPRGSPCATWRRRPRPPR